MTETQFELAAGKPGAILGPQIQMKQRLETTSTTLPLPPSSASLCESLYLLLSQAFFSLDVATATDSSRFTPHTVPPERSPSSFIQIGKIQENDTDWPSLKVTHPSLQPEGGMLTLANPSERCGGARGGSTRIEK